MASRDEAAVLSYSPVEIPSARDFLKTWDSWVYSRVTRMYKRNKSRIQDTVQNVKLRLLQKDFIGRWFFKHLVDELVDLEQATRILGGISPYPADGQIKYFVVKPFIRRTPREMSLWRVRDLLAYAKFDYDSYYYSVQNHSIDSAKVLLLLGHSEDEYGVLESLYRQGRLRPSEFDDHACIEREDLLLARPSSGCREPGCMFKHFSRGFCKLHYGRSRSVSCGHCTEARATLRRRGLSLQHRWIDSPKEASKLRWMDTQLRPLLRGYRKQNVVRSVPSYIMRPRGEPDIRAGLLKYTEIVISNAVRNDFKLMARHDDLDTFVATNALSPETSNADVLAHESGEDDSMRILYRDPNSSAPFVHVEFSQDIQRIVNGSGLDEKEQDVLYWLDLREESVGEYAQRNGMTKTVVNQLHQTVMEKLRATGAEDMYEEL